MAKFKFDRRVKLPEHKHPSNGRAPRLKKVHELEWITNVVIDENGLQYEYTDENGVSKVLTNHGGFKR